MAAPNLLADSVLYSWAGVSFGQGETYRLNLSLKKHAETVDAGYEAIKFWGKVRCVVLFVFYDEMKCCVDHNHFMIK